VNAYGTSPIKRKRRSNDEMGDLLQAARTIIDGYEDPISIRHLFYRLVGERRIAKDESEYKKLCSHLAKWRRSGDISYAAFVDGTRWHLGSTIFDDAAAALRDSVTGYRKNLWKDQDHYVEVWVEKDAIAAMVSDVADVWGIKTFICRGFASISSTYSCAQTFKRAIQNGKKPVILYMGDHDPSGVAIDVSLMKHMEDYGIADQVEFHRVAILVDQIVEFDLPTRPAKKNDGRGKGWVGECVEIDTLSTAQIQSLLEERIESYVDQDAWERTKKIEEAERHCLIDLFNNNRTLLATAGQGEA